MAWLWGRFKQSFCDVRFYSRDGKALERFLQDYFDGKLKRYLKSEPIPENNDGPVKVRQGFLFPMTFCLIFKRDDCWRNPQFDLVILFQVLVAENFDSIVNDDSKDVLIEFYAPWCGHCKSLEPKYKELGEKVSF